MTGSIPFLVLEYGRLRLCRRDPPLYPQPIRESFLGRTQPAFGCFAPRRAIDLALYKDKAGKPAQQNPANRSIGWQRTPKTKTSLLLSNNGHCFAV